MPLAACWLLHVALLSPKSKPSSPRVSVSVISDAFPFSILEMVSSLCAVPHHRCCWHRVNGSTERVSSLCVVSLHRCRWCRANDPGPPEPAMAQGGRVLPRGLLPLLRAQQYPCMNMCCTVLVLLRLCSTGRAPRVCHGACSVWMRCLCMLAWCATLPYAQC